ncbi:hypothetical protein PAPYR_8239 [Paratrimastix pyriformis]|uniref:Uncharacterized protein n=1 Tax=Paratrimastix pyriformis TaxID=342808 RepID=A0ABQ8UDQ7_9EUKA|nr:hypothetical protein PAPYR_8239 [Paratrimastix pyriformis]
MASHMNARPSRLAGLHMRTGFLFAVPRGRIPMIPPGGQVTLPGRPLRAGWPCSGPSIRTSALYHAVTRDVLCRYWHTCQKVPVPGAPDSVLRGCPDS